ncbi:class II glutamine amidotransferase [Labedaea rhizosphaerae]|uniref:class II glutamine amidotransferase n=1 Tax=Labedaea rhizosphaerae TaxID=598644 RepID=UPI001414F176|nr:class II glutamine amidotransferase [Labedaea rhizosphaerae]
MINDQGHGYAIVADDILVVERGMDAADVIESFVRTRERHPDGPALFHSRWATHGTVTVDNCHPFQIGNDRKTVLAHNGVLPAALQPVRGDNRSDTRVLAEDYLPAQPLGPLSNRRSRARLAKMITASNKLVILTVNRRYRYNVYLINETSGLWHDGIWYSNNDFRSGLSQYAAGTAWDGVCWCCEQVDTLVDDRYCRVCGACAECMTWSGVCDCYEQYLRDRWPTEPASA